MSRSSEKSWEFVCFAIARQEFQPRLIRPLICALAAVLMCTGWALGQTDTWLGGSGNWSNPGKWSAGVPGASSNVFIDNGNPLASAVTLDVVGQANNLTIDSDDSLSFNNGVELTLNGNSISNAGTIALNSSGTFTLLLVANGAILSGSGKVVLASNAEVDGNGGTTLTNQSTIQGVGVIGPHFAFANNGTVNANVSSGILALEQATGATDTNTSILEATNGGILQIATNSGASVNNAGGTIEAIGANSQVQLTGFGTIINGGTMTTSSGGMIVQPPGSSSTLNGVTNAGMFSVQNGTTVNLNGTITNTGTMQVNSLGNLTLLNVPTAATLAGSGSVTLTDNSLSAIDGNSGAMLTNQSTIQGVGTIGPHLTFVNNATVDANVSGGILALTQATGATDTNTSILEATNGGILQIATNSGASINNTGGTIEAVGANSQVQLTGFGTIISGGTLSTSSGGAIIQPSGSSSSLTGVTNASAFSILNGASVELTGPLMNNGTISVKSAGNLTLLNLPTVSVSVSGKGKVVLNNNPLSGIDGNSGLTFTNQSTVQGGGAIGPHVALNNKGTLSVPAANTLNVNGPFANFAGNTLTGGTYLVTGTLEFTNANIVTNSAKITLTGKSARITNQGLVNALTGIAMNSKGALFSLVSGNMLSTIGAVGTGAFTNAGTLKIGTNSGLQIAPTPPLVGSYTQTAGSTTVDGLLTVPSVSIQAGTLFGAGTIMGSVTSSGGVTAGDSATVPRKLSPSVYTQNSTGSLTIPIGGTIVGTQYGQLAVTNGASLNGTLNIKLIKNFIPQIGNMFTILTGSAVSGTFNTVNGLSINGNEHFTIAYNPTNVTLTVAPGP